MKRRDAGAPREDLVADQIIAAAIEVLKILELGLLNLSKRCFSEISASLRLGVRKIPGVKKSLHHAPAIS